MNSHATENNQEAEDNEDLCLLTEEEQTILALQNKRLVSEFKQKKFENEAKKHWDLFYKRNETRFFKDRHWTTKEFHELVDIHQTNAKLVNILEVGCGVGNFVFPLLEEGKDRLFVYACDFSSRAIEFIKSDSRYHEKRIHVFQHNVTQEFHQVPANHIDIVSMIFVLSAIKPELFSTVFRNIMKILKPGGIIIFRDYGLYDRAMVRFNPGSKIYDKYYLRQDGTTSYFFDKSEMKELAETTGFVVLENRYVCRRTINKKEDTNARRIFIQGKYRKKF